jgi:hypothetical protein
VPDALTVHLSRDGPHSIEAPQAFEATGSFDVIFENHGSALHAHVGLDPTLSEAATVRTPNRYVEEDFSRRVRVDVDPGERPVEGRLELVTGYGSTTEYVSVSLVDAQTANTGVDVDERLGQPQSSPGNPVTDPQRLPLLALLGIAALLAVVVAVIVQDVFVTVAVLIVLLGVAVAGFLLVT